MTELLIILQIILMGLMIYVILSNNNLKTNKVIIDKENKKRNESFKEYEKTFFNNSINRKK